MKRATISGVGPMMPDGLPARRQALAAAARCSCTAELRDVAQVAHRRRKIARPDENRIDAGNGGDLVQLGERRQRFDLYDHADLLARALQVIGHGPVTAAAMRSGDAAHAVRRIARVGDRAPRLVGVLHERQQQRLRAGIERALDHHHVVPRRAHDRLRRRPGDRPQDVDHLRRVDRRVLHVDDEKVEPGAAERLRGRRRAASEPRAERRAAGCDRALELIDRKIHRMTPRSGWRGPLSRGCAIIGANALEGLRPGARSSAAGPSLFPARCALISPVRRSSKARATCCR